MVYTVCDVDFSASEAFRRLGRHVAVRQLVVRGQNVPVSEEYWDYVADEQSVKDAEVYRQGLDTGILLEILEASAVSTDLY